MCCCKLGVPLVETAALAQRRRRSMLRRQTAAAADRQQRHLPNGALTKPKGWPATCPAHTTRHRATVPCHATSEHRCGGRHAAAAEHTQAAVFSRLPMMGAACQSEASPGLGDRHRLGYLGTKNQTSLKQGNQAL